MLNIRLTPHPYIPDHYLGKGGGWSVLHGDYATGGNGWEVMDPEGDVHGFATMGECEAYINGRIEMDHSEVFADNPNPLWNGLLILVIIATGVYLIFN